MPCVHTSVPHGLLRQRALGCPQPQGQSLLPSCRRRLGATGAPQRSTERGRSWTYTQTPLPPLRSGWVSNARILECSRLFSHGQARDRKPMVPRGVHGRRAKRGRHRRQVFVLRRLFALAVVQDLRRMRLHESCRRGIAAGNETVGSIAAEKAMRGERGYVSSIMRRIDRSAASADFLWHRRIDGWRKLAGGAGAAAEERARPVAGTVAGVAAKHTGQTSSELQWLGCGSVPRSNPELEYQDSAGSPATLSVRHWQTARLPQQ